MGYTSWISVWLVFSGNIFFYFVWQTKFPWKTLGLIKIHSLITVKASSEDSTHFCQHNTPILIFHYIHTCSLQTLVQAYMYTRHSIRFSRPMDSKLCRENSLKWHFKIARIFKCLGLILYVTSALKRQPDMATFLRGLFSIFS